MTTKILIPALVLALLLTAAGGALANGGPALPRWVLGGGASDAAAGDVTLRATMGQPIIGGISGGDITLGQGFWYGGAVPGHTVYLPLVVRN